MHPQSDLVLDTPVMGNDELAEGLMIVRASTLKVIRLQLAMERNDRRVAIEAIDELIALDRRMEAYLAHVPALPDRRLEQALLLDRSALNREKLTLAAEIRRNANDQALFRQPPLNHPSDDDLVVRSPPASEQFADGQPEWIPEPYEGTPRRRWLLALMFLLLLAALAAGALMIGGLGYPLSVEALIGGLR